MNDTTTRTPTLHDVAREAGVSLATASRVLNGSTRQVAAAYRERVEAAAATLGYTANLSAQATARGTSAVVALLVADIADPYFGQIASGVARAADAEGLVVNIAVTERDPQREVRLLRSLRGQRPRAVILAASRSTESNLPEVVTELDALAAVGSSVVMLGRGDALRRRVPVDNLGGARALGTALAARGYRKAIILAAAEGVATSDDRILGFTEGFSGEIKIRRCGFTRDSGLLGMNEALAAGVDEGTVVFGVSDVVAIGAMRAIRDHDREVGTDIAVCGFDDIPTSRDVTPGLTTVRIPLEAFGQAALRAALDLEDDGADRQLEVILRDSTPVRA